MFLLRVCGPSGWALLAITLIAAGYIAAAVMRRVRHESTASIDHARHAVLFWGGMAAVLGFLSQCAAVFEAMTAIMSATAIDPNVVRQGFGQSFVPSFWGFGVLTACAMVWIILGVSGRRTERSMA